MGDCVSSVVSYFLKKILKKTTFRVTRFQLRRVYSYLKSLVMIKWDDLFQRSDQIVHEAIKRLSGAEKQAATETDEALIEHLQDSSYMFKAWEMREMYDYRQAYRTLKKTGRSGKLRYVGMAAAVAACVLAVCLLVIRLDEKSRSDTILVAEEFPIKPGEMKATLTTADGQIRIIGKETLLLSGESGIKMAIDTGRIEYRTMEPITESDTLKYNVLEVPRGGMFQLKLSDGTNIWLNSETTLVYPEVFAEGKREIILIGEAFFDVARDEQNPFVVKTDLGDITVLGTSFNIKRYPDEPAMLATLVSGSIRFENKIVPDEILTPGYQLKFDPISGISESYPVKTQLYTGWKDHEFQFEQASLEDIMRTLARWYDVEVIFEAEQYKKMIFTGNLDKYTNITTFFRLFEAGSDVRFSVKDKTVYVCRK